MSQCAISRRGTAPRCRCLEVQHSMDAFNTTQQCNGATTGLSAARSAAISISWLRHFIVPLSSHLLRSVDCFPGNQLIFLAEFGSRFCRFVMSCVTWCGNYGTFSLWQSWPQDNVPRCELLLRVGLCEGFQGSRIINKVSLWIYRSKNVIPRCSNVNSGWITLGTFDYMLIIWIFTTGKRFRVDLYKLL